MNEKITILTLEQNTIDILEKTNIQTIKDLWIMNRHELKKINLSDQQVNQIIIQLQLIGLDLNKKSYN